MRLFGQEMKKIWRPGILAAIVLIGAMFYWIRPDYYREYYGGHRPLYQLSAEWAEKYGPTMEQSERDELDGQMEEEKEIFAQQIANIPEAAEAGITDYDSFESFVQAHYDAIKDDAGDVLAGSTIQDAPYHSSELFTQRERLIRRIEGGTNCERIDNLDYFMFCYDYSLDEPTSSNEHFQEIYSPREQARVLELEAMDQRGYLPQTTVDAYYRYLSIWNILGVILLLSPALVRDRLHRVRSMQWSSNTGRRVLDTQIKAGMASALIFSVISTIVYTIIYLTTDVLIFKDFPLFNNFYQDFVWFDITYGQYILFLIGLAVLSGLIAGALTLFFSYYSGNYVAIVLKAVPLFLILYIVVSMLESSILYFHRTHIMIDDKTIHCPKEMEFIAFVLLMAAGLGLCVWICARQKKKELV